MIKIKHNVRVKDCYESKSNGFTYRVRKIFGNIVELKIVDDNKQNKPKMIITSIKNLKNPAVFSKIKNMVFKNAKNELVTIKIVERKNDARIDG